MDNSVRIRLASKRLAGNVEYSVLKMEENNELEAVLQDFDEVLERLNASKVFSRLDLTIGYYQNKVKDSDKDKTAFVYGFYVLI